VGRKSFAFLDALVVAALLVAGIVVRSRGIPFMQLDENTIYPYVRALYLLDGWTGAPLPLPRYLDSSWFWPHMYTSDLQFGPGLIWAHVPLLAGASSLSAVFARRFIVQAAVAPLLYLALRSALGSKTAAGRSASGMPPWPSMAASLSCAVIVGFTGYPFGPLSPYDETYLAPEMAAWIAACTLVALAANRAKWLLPCLALVAFTPMVHPFAVSYAVGAGLGLLVVFARGHRRAAAWAVAAAAVVALPEVVHLAGVFTSPVDDLTSAASNCDDQRRTIVTLLARSAEYMGQLQPRPVGYVLALSPLVALPMAVWSMRKDRSLRGGSSLERIARISGIDLLTIWCCGNCGGFLVAAWAVGCLQPWHWGILLPSLAVQVAVVVFVAARALQGALDRRSRILARAVGVAILVAAVLLAVAAVRTRWHEEPLGFGKLRACRWFAQTIQEDVGQGDRWIEVLTLDRRVTGYPWIYPSALVIEQRLHHGLEPGIFDATGPLYLVVDGTGAQIALVAENSGWTLPSPSEELPALPATHRWSPAVEAADTPGISLVGMYTPDAETSLLLLRMEDAEASSRWTRSLCEWFPRREVRTHFDAMDYFDEIRGGADHSLVEPWFDRCVAP